MLTRIHMAPQELPSTVKEPNHSPSSSSLYTSSDRAMSTTRSSIGSSFASSRDASYTSSHYAEDRALSAALKGSVAEYDPEDANMRSASVVSAIAEDVEEPTEIIQPKEEPVKVNDLASLPVQAAMPMPLPSPSKIPLPTVKSNPPQSTPAASSTPEANPVALSTPAIVPSQTPITPVKPKRARYGLRDFMFHRTLGTGSFGRVHLVQSLHNSRHYAIKVLAKEKVVRLKQVEHTNSERSMLLRARHPFLVNLWGTFQDSANLYMVMDFVAGGELFSLLRKSGRFPNPVAKFYAAEVSMAIDYLHSISIIYRDLKPENILISADGHIKLTDFGFAKYVPDLTYTLCGTPDYLAPEVIQQKGYNKSVDWYSVGILIFEMLAGYPPFYVEGASSHVALYEKIIAGHVHYPPFFDPLAIDIVRNCLTTDLSKRYGNMKFGSKDIFGHSWFAEVGWEKIYKKEIPPPYVPRIEGEGDSSQFDRYPEADISGYGAVGEDPFEGLFREWSA